MTLAIGPVVALGELALAPAPRFTRLASRLSTDELRVDLTLPEAPEPGSGLPSSSPSSASAARRVNAAMLAAKPEARPVSVPVAAELPAVEVAPSRLDGSRAGGC